MKFFSTLLMCIVAFTATADEALLKFTDVFVGGEEGYHTYRIPAITTTKSGALLAFAEGRVSRSDHARNDIVLKRSRDNGATWEPVKLVAEAGENSLNNPCVVVVRETGRVLLNFQYYPKESGGERGVVVGVTGDMICKNYLIYSDDEGDTWSEWRDITPTTKRPVTVTSIASGPGNGIQLRHGKYAGRIVFPMNQGPFGEWRVYAVYSDDFGETWTYGNVAPNGEDRGLGNEVLMAELSDGSIRINSRSYQGKRHRKTAVSTDGGETWSPLEDIPELREPQCNAGFIRLSNAADGDKNRLLYTGPISTNSRTKGTAYISYDDGKTWPVSREIEAGKWAYSALTRVANGNAGCLFETGDKDAYDTIRFAEFNVEWISNGDDESK
jgi:sialidase-1